MKNIDRIRAMTAEDLKKAVWYIERYIKLLEEKKK